jgi:membrane associated rhomboid family serine protease
MGIYDRDYVRDRRGPASGGGAGLASIRFLSVNAWLIIVNVGVFVFQGLLASPNLAKPVAGWPHYAMDPLMYFGHFSTTRGIFAAEVWRLVTFQFLHGSLLHLFFNMFGLWVFGSIVEQYLGSKRYLAFYLVCGIFGGLMYVVLNLAGQTGIPIPGALGNNMATPLIGASAGVFGVIVACAYISPNSVVQLLFPPIPLKLKYFAYGYVAIAMISLIAGTSNAGGEAAHVGGAIAGFFFIRRSHLLRDFFDVFEDSRKKPPKPRKRTRAEDAELDRILAKIKAEGVHSISERERRILRSATDDKRSLRA